MYIIDHRRNYKQKIKGYHIQESKNFDIKETNIIYSWVDIYDHFIPSWILFRTPLILLLCSSYLVAGSSYVYSDTIMLPTQTKQLRNFLICWTRLDLRTDCTTILPRAKMRNWGNSTLCVISKALNDIAVLFCYCFYGFLFLLKFQLSFRCWLFHIKLILVCKPKKPSLKTSLKSILIN